MRRALWLILLCAVPSGADTWALLVGVEEYEDGEITPLRYAVADARAVASALETAGLERRTVTVLTSDALEPLRRPTRNNVLRTLALIADRAAADDTFLFFFAGHGLQRPGQPPLLLTVDANRRLPDQTALAMPDLEAALALLPCRRVLLFVDACRNNPEAGRSQADNALGQDLARNLRPHREPGRAAQEAAVVFACDVGQRAWEMGTAGHGAFTYFLLQALDGAAAGEDRLLTVGEAVDYVAARLRDWCTQRGKPLQEPRLMGVAAAWPLLRLPAPRGVELTLETDPPGARVFVDSRDTGLATPCRLFVPFSGDVRQQAVGLEFRRIGYRAKRLEVTVDAARGADVPAVRLERVDPVLEDPLAPIPVPYASPPSRGVPPELRDEATVRRHLTQLGAAALRWAQGHGGRLPPSVRWPELLAESLPDDLLLLVRGEAPCYAYCGPAAGRSPTDPKARVLFFESDLPGPAAAAHVDLAAPNRRGDQAYFAALADGTVQRVRLSGVELEQRRARAAEHRWLWDLSEGLWQVALREGYPQRGGWTVRLVELGFWPGALPPRIREHTVYYNAGLAGLAPTSLASLDRTVLCWVARGAQRGFDAATAATGEGLGGGSRILVLMAAGWSDEVAASQLAGLLRLELPAPEAAPAVPLFEQSRAQLLRLYQILVGMNTAWGRLPTGDRWQDMVDEQAPSEDLGQLPGHPNAYALNPWLAGRPLAADPLAILVFETDRPERNTSDEADAAVPKAGWHGGKVAVVTAAGRILLLPPDEVRRRLAPPAGADEPLE